MKYFLRSMISTICIILFANLNFAQEQKPQPPKADINVFQHISEYSNLSFIEMPTDESKSELPLKGENSYPIDIDIPNLPDNGSRGVQTTTTVFHDFRYRPETYLTYDQGVTFSPGIYRPNYGYRYQWQPTVITFPQPAVSITINVFDYGNSTHGARLIAYDETGNYMGQITTNHYNWYNITYTAPSGQKIGHIVMQNENRTYYRWYTRYMWITYENNQPPVAIAQDVTTNTASNCQADVLASQIDNGSYDPDGDPLTYSLSPAGPYALGNTNVTLTVSDGELSSTADAIITVLDNIAPQANLTSLPDLTGECDVTVSSVPTATDNCAGTISGTTVDALYYDQQGTYTVTWSYDDGNGNVSAQTQTVIVDDVTAPVITATANPLTLWPPNHKYHTVNVSECFTSISDNCASLSNSDVTIVKVTSDEEEDANGGGDGNTIDDIVIGPDCKSVDLRKERKGNGNGRVYTIHMEIEDGNGNTGTATYQVHVPKNNNGTAVDDGAVYEVQGNCGAKNAVAFGNEGINEVTLQAYPNPTYSNAIVEFTLSESTHAAVYVYNVMGLKVATLFDGMVESDHTTKLVFDGSYLAKGLYFIKLQSNNSVSKTTKLLLNK